LPSKKIEFVEKNLLLLALESCHDCFLELPIVLSADSLPRSVVSKSFLADNYLCTDVETLLSLLRPKPSF
jgi:hypothetical protein